VHACYDLLLDSDLYSAAEIIIPISHCLIGCPGAVFESITALNRIRWPWNSAAAFLSANPQIKRMPARILPAASRELWARAIRVMRPSLEEGTEEYGA